MILSNNSTSTIDYLVRDNVFDNLYICVDDELKYQALTKIWQVVEIFCNININSRPL